MGGKAAVVGTLGEQELGWVGTQDPSKRKEERFAERNEAVVQKR